MYFLESVMTTKTTAIFSHPRTSRRLALHHLERPRAIYSGGPVVGLT